MTSHLPCKSFPGWESRRRRTAGHDMCIIQLGCRGSISGVNIDTSFFDGNHPHSIKVDGHDGASNGEISSSNAHESAWCEIVPVTEVGPNCHNYIRAEAKMACTHLRYHMFPDGGTARLRAYGTVVVDWEPLKHEGETATMDLAAFENGGCAIACSDEHFGAMQNLCFPGDGVNMADGWETRRRRGPGFDWVIIRLGAPTNVESIIIGTMHFKGNFPHSASVEGVFMRESDADPIIAMGWFELVPKSELRADENRHLQVGTKQKSLAVTHVRLNINPDGGISRLRVFGVVDSQTAMFSR
eukprot:TRINITY_DN15649_c0_g1_i1.p1 TRINITY_DN15649_c0_g1~~TRINITY_DN15649_c0_g1_i1.p1  ORF type:complete len:299 (+),score=21.73 TRINITY_DN15649_c0_g1_i1:407-1303(+)